MFKNLLVTIALLVTSVTASAGGKMEQYLDWIAKNTPYTEATSLKKSEYPKLFVLPVEQFKKEYGEDTQAAYSLVNKNIFTYEGNTPGERFDAIMVHELVHFFQDRSGKKFECMEAMEKEAYAAQIKYLTERNLEVPMTKLQIALLTMCMQKPAYAK